MILISISTKKIILTLDFVRPPVAIVHVDGLMGTHKIIRSFRKCRRCQGTNTKQLRLDSEVLNIVFCGWCDDCNREYTYSERMDNIHDKENRL